MKAKGVKFFQEFKDFISKGNVLNLAVGVIVGSAFTGLTNSMVNNIIMPLLSPVMGQLDFTNWFVAMDGQKYATLADAQAAGISVLAYGSFITQVIDFLLMALCVFMIVKVFSKLERKKPTPPPAAPTTKKCPFCFMEVPIEATRCGHCTSELPAEEAAE